MQYVPVMQSWIVSIITPVFSVTWSFGNNSDLVLDLDLKSFVTLCIYLAWENPDNFQQI